jgi:hypothetical protein
MKQSLTICEIVNAVPLGINEDGSKTIDIVSLPSGIVGNIAEISKPPIRSMLIRFDALRLIRVINAIAQRRANDIDIIIVEDRDITISTGGEIDMGSLAEFSVVAVFGVSEPCAGSVIVEIELLHPGLLSCDELVGGRDPNASSLVGRNGCVDGHDCTVSQHRRDGEGGDDD